LWLALRTLIEPSIDLIRVFLEDDILNLYGHLDHLGLAFSYKIDYQLKSVSNWYTQSGSWSTPSNPIESISKDIIFEIEMIHVSLYGRYNLALKRIFTGSPYPKVGSVPNDLDQDQ